MGDGYLQRILRAPVYDVAIETPLERADRLSDRLGNEVLIKREDLQPVFSFKLRGAYNRLSLLGAAERADGVVAASAGNHAQGVALAANRLGIAARIVMPTTTPEIKVEAVRRHGAEAILHGDTFDEAAEHARALVRADGGTFIPPYDDPDVIAGQGTVAMELLRQRRGHIDAVFVPVGGGGLLAGIVAYLREIAPKIRIYGVEPDDAACLQAAVAAGKPVDLATVGIFADGVAVRRIGAMPWEVIEGRIDGVITVSTDEICAGIKDIFDDTRSIAEPAGALAVAGLKRYVKDGGVRGQTLVAIDSGANMNFDRLRHVAERAEVGEAREALFGVTIPERPGAFGDFIETIQGLPITEFNYRYGDAQHAHVFVGVGLDDAGRTRERVRARIADAGLPVTDMTDSELAKLHVRFMVGGRAGVPDEQLISFEFPERPGALSRFLSAVGGRWNISLFHYRNHGAAHGRVLAGMQVPPGAQPELTRFLDELGYPYRNVSADPAYRLFLR